MANKNAKKLAKQEAKAAKRAEKAKRRAKSRKAEAVLTRAAMAEQLRALASQVESGTFTLGDLELELPEHAEFEISYKPTKWGGHEIEVEIEWGKTRTASLLPTE
jgi:amphi-Trp domain-containing protein